MIVDVTPQGDGCELVLRHDLGPEVGSDAVIERTEQGWTRMLQQLEQALQVR